MAAWEPTKQLGTSWVPNAIPHEVQVIFWICVVKMIFAGLSFVNAICGQKQKYDEVATGEDPEKASALQGKVKAVEK